MNSVTVRLRNGQRQVEERRADAVTPAADIYETPDAFVLMLEIPGATKEGIHLSIDQGSLLVKAGVAPLHTGDATLLIREIGTTNYHRIITLGEGIDLRNIDARFELGVLTVKMLKSESVKPQEITLK